MKVALVVLNYNAKDLLERYLPSVMRAAAESRHHCRVVVLDNASSDGSAELVRSRFPGAELYIAKENRVLCSYNEWLERSDDDVALLLNNDLELKSGFVDPLVEVFEKHEDAFFAASRGNRAIGKFKHGILEPATDYPDREKLIDVPGWTLSAGVAAFDRKKFLELGGFDDLYLPGRYEDMDLCWRGWKRGWKGYYVPQSDQEHEEGASFKKEFGWDKTQRMVLRNSLLFMTKNIEDPFRRGYVWFLFLIRIPVWLFSRKFYMWQGMVDYFKRRSMALERRKKVKQQFVLSDREVLRLVNGGSHGV